MRMLCVILLFPVGGRGEEPVIRGCVEICASQLQTSSSEESSQHHQPTGKRWRHLCNWSTVRLKHFFCVFVCVFKEHPLLGQPFFMLHPCRTEEFMRPVLQDQHRYNHHGKSQSYTHTRTHTCEVKHFKTPGTAVCGV